MSKVVLTHVVITAQAYGNFRHGQVVPVEELPPGDYWKNYLNDGIRYATEDEVSKDFVTITRLKNTPGSAEIELADTKSLLRKKQALIDQLELDAARARNDHAQTESPSLLAGKDKEIKELKVSLADTQQKLAKSQAENIGLKQQLEAAGALGGTGAGGSAGSEPPPLDGQVDPTNAQTDGTTKPNGKGTKKVSSV